MTKEKKELIQRDNSPQRALPASAVKAMMDGDWKQVSQPDRITFIKYRCEALSIPIVLNPFKFITMKGRTVLYSTAEAAFSLARKNKMSVKITDERFDKESQILTIFTTVTFPNGNSSDDVGKIYLGGLTGVDRANAEMKAVTKAKRRAILGALGLNELDEDEIKYYRKPEEHEHVETIQCELVPEEDSEDMEWRTQLFDYATGKGGPFEGDPQGLEETLKEEGLELMKMNASQCEDILAKMKGVDGEE